VRIDELYYSKYSFTMCTAQLAGFSWYVLCMCTAEQDLLPPTANKTVFDKVFSGYQPR
jgi:hypothetical protein